MPLDFTDLIPTAKPALSFADLVPTAKPDYTGWDTAPPVPTVGLPPQRKPFLADEPGYQYGSVLPFRKNIATREVEAAVPEMVRAPVRGVQIDPMRFDPNDPQQRADLGAAAALLGGVRAPGEFATTPPRPLTGEVQPPARQPPPGPRTPTRGPDIEGDAVLPAGGALTFDDLVPPSRQMAAPARALPAPEEAPPAAEPVAPETPTPTEVAAPTSAPTSTPSRAGQIEALNPAQIGVDAPRFQFKSGGDTQGVTDRLSGVTEWNPLLAGTALVWRDTAGKDWIADGHQRLGLAQRIGADNPDIRINAFVLDAAHGITDADARAIAAAKNIAEGTGTPIDAAKVIRESVAAGIRLPPLPPRSVLVRDGEALARLGDDAFGMAVNEVVPTQQAAIVGRLVSDPMEQTEAMRVLAKIKPDNARQAEMIVRDVMATGTERMTQQGGLFGDEAFASSPVLERARVADEAMRQLARDRTTFRTLVAEAERIGGHGANVLDEGANRARLSDDERAKQLLTSLATTRGPVSAALTGIARRVKSGDITAAAGAREFLGAVRDHDPRELDQGATPGGAVNGAGDAGSELGLAQPRRLPAPPPAGLDLFGTERPTAQAPRVPEPTIRADPAQRDMFGRTDAAVQAQAARDQAGRGGLQPKVPQANPDQGIFAHPEPPQPTLPYVPFSGNSRTEFGDFLDRSGLGDVHVAAAQYPVARGIKTNTEHLTAYDPHRQAVIAAHTSDKPDFVEFTPELRAVMDDSANAIVAHHNHPSGSSLSLTDMKALAMPGLAQVIAHGHNGEIFAGRLGERLRKLRSAGMDVSDLQQIIYEEYTRVRKALNVALWEPMGRGEIAVDQIAPFWNDLIARGLHETGIIDYMTTGSIPKELLPIVQKAVERAAIKGAKDARIDRPAFAVRAAEGLARIFADARDAAAKRSRRAPVEGDDDGVFAGRGAAGGLSEEARR